MDHASAGPDTTGTSGHMVVVVGPSGAGKDTLMAFAARHLAGRTDVVFVRRAITRDGDAGGEDHDAVSDAEFDRLAETGGFAVSWGAHGLRYGIPSSTVKQVEDGLLVIANGSRSALPRFKAAFRSMTVVNITARPDVLAERLLARGRETREEVMRRLERGSPALDGDYDVLTIDNSGSVDEAGQAMIAALTGCLAAPRAL